MSIGKITGPIPIVHVTTCHPANDPRIYRKQCRTLAQNGYRVYLIGRESCQLDDINFIPLPQARKFLGKLVFDLLTRMNFVALRAALETRAKIIHFHDPHFIPVAICLKLIWKKIVIYDSHEDAPRQLGRVFSSPRKRRWFEKIADAIELWCARRYDHVIAPTEFIHSRFVAGGCKASIVYNYPIVKHSRCSSENYCWEGREAAVAYVGYLSPERGIKQIVDAMNYVDGKLYLAGKFSTESFRKECEENSGWKHVEFVGYLNDTEMTALMNRVRCGLVALQPVQSYLDGALPTKMFEYMMHGIPVIVSDFPFWRQIVENTGCGILVDPTCPKQIGSSIDKLLSDNTEAQRLGLSGKEAVSSDYSWDATKQTLLDVYKQLAKRDNTH